MASVHSLLLQVHIIIFVEVRRAAIAGAMVDKGRMVSRARSLSAPRSVSIDGLLLLRRRRGSGDRGEPRVLSAIFSRAICGSVATSPFLTREAPFQSDVGQVRRYNQPPPGERS
jgi:hypothetical protein